MITQFLLKIVFYIALTIGICFGVQALIAPKIRDYNAYVGASLDKEQRLARLPTPRLVFVGGSNFVFGLDCKRLSDSLGLPSINMALHAGLGVQFMLNEALDGLKKGDIVVVSTEYGLGVAGNRKLQAQLVDVNPKAFGYIGGTISDKMRFTTLNWQRCLSSLFLKLTGKLESEIHNRTAFSPEGDLIAHLEMPQPAAQTDKGKMTFKGYNDGILALNQFVRSAHQRGAKVYFSFPSFMASEYELSREAIAAYYNLFKSELACPLLNTPQDMVFPDTDFFDTVYHLNKAGREKRTQVMIAALKPVIAATPIQLTQVAVPKTI